LTISIFLKKPENEMMNLEFLYPRYFYMLLMLIPLIIWYIYSNNRYQPFLNISSIKQFEGNENGIWNYLRHVPFILRILIFSLIIIILARPQSTNSWDDNTVEGIDIVIALDISGSMLAGDFTPNRIEASKNVASEFIAGRPNDRIGLVLFGGESFTQCPLTTDHKVLTNLLQNVEVGIIEDRSTAIGLGLANSVMRLRNSQAISRVIILVTDGVNNAGSINPMTAADIALTYGIRVYTIGVGTRGMAPYPVEDYFGNIYYQPMQVEIDEEMLSNIADITRGQYFRATNNEAMKEIYNEIDKLEKSKIDIIQFNQKQDEYRIYAFYLLILILLETLFRNVFLRSMV